MGVYEDLGVRPVINAAGPLTRLSGMPLHPEVAAAMARGVAHELQATFGLATTGVAGPDPQDGRAPGEVHLALAGPGIGSGGTVVASLALSGGRDDVRRETVRRALALAVEQLAAHGKPGKQAG